MIVLAFLVGQPAVLPTLAVTSDCSCASVIVGGGMLLITSLPFAVPAPTP